MAPHSCSDGCIKAHLVACAIARREFLRQSLLIGAASWIASACGVGVTTPAEPDLANLGPSGTVISLAAYPAIDHVGGIAKINVPGGVPIAVVRTGDTQFDAFWMSCPHQGVVVDIHSDGFECPNHLARFAPDGTWIGGHPTAQLTAIPLVYDASSGAITLGIAPAEPPPPRQPKSFTIDVRNEPSLSAVGGIYIFGRGNGYPGALVRMAATEFLALSPICPHRAYYVDVDESGRGFLCPGHGAMFTANGTWYGGQPTTNLSVLSSVYDAAAGTVTVTVP